MTGFLALLVLFLLYKLFRNFYVRNKVNANRGVHVLSNPMKKLISLKDTEQDLQILYVSFGIVDRGFFDAKKQILYKVLSDGSLYERYEFKYTAENLLSETYFIELQGTNFIAQPLEV